MYDTKRHFLNFVYQFAMNFQSPQSYLSSCCVKDHNLSSRQLLFSRNVQYIQVEPGASVFLTLYSTSFHSTQHAFAVVLARVPILDEPLGFPKSAVRLPFLRIAPTKYHRTASSVVSMVMVGDLMLIRPKITLSTFSNLALLQ
jgi:hypothetical protein